MILILIGIIALLIIVLLLVKIVKLFDKEEESTAVVVIGAVLFFLGIPFALLLIISGISALNKISEWEIKEAIGSTLLDDKEECVLNGYTYQYIIPDRWSTKPDIINYTIDDLLEDDPPILVRCERKARPTIWTLGLGHKETKYVFYNSDDTISEIELK